MDIVFKACNPKASCFMHESGRVSSNPVLRKKILFTILLIREFEEALLDLQDQGLVHGPLHTSIGQEAIAAGTALSLGRQDMIGSTHRAHGHFLANIIAKQTDDGFDPAFTDISFDVQLSINRTMAEIMGLKYGWCSGRGGSMHLSDPESGFLGSNAIVGGGIPITTGAAWAERLQGRDGLSVCFLGDGAVNQGCFHEAANLAKLWEVPVIYMIENNLYAVGTSTRESSYCEDLGLRGIPYGIDGYIADGMDPEAIHGVVRNAIDLIRDGSGPLIIEAKTYRFTHHAGRIPGSLYGYRSKEEEAGWQSKDPFVQYPENLLKQGILGESELEFLRKSVKSSIREAVSFCTELDEDDKRIISEVSWPEADSIKRDLRGENPAINEEAHPDDFTDRKSVSFSDAIAAVTCRHLAENPKVFVAGEEVGHLRGGPYGATKGCVECAPDRVLSTPISECGFVGLSAGAAARGMRPVVEIMFPDFALVAADQLFNQAGKLRHMYGGQVNFPMVVRTRIAIGQGYGGQHSMDPVGLFNLFSGWRIIAPSSPFDYIGLFNTAMMMEDPVLIVEHADLYKTTGEIPSDSLNYRIPYGSAKVLKKGSDATIISYLASLTVCLKAAEELSKEGVDVEVIDLRTLDFTGMDFDLLVSSVKKTGRIITVEQSPESMGIGQRIAAELYKRCFDSFKTAASAVFAPDVPHPVSKELEAAMIPSPGQVKDAVRDVCSRVSTGVKLSEGSRLPNVSATPLARKIADRMNIPLSEIKGSGIRGKIYKDDVLSHQQANEVPKQNETMARETSTFPPDEIPGSYIGYSGMRKTIGDRLSTSKFTAPHVYFFADIDMKPALDAKGKIVAEGLKLSLNDILIKAVALTLRDFPMLNARIENNSVKQWTDINVGLAVALKNGLIVPAVPHADELGLEELINERYTLVKKAREGQLAMDEIARGTFTISSLAKSDITFFTAIINPPQSAILSVGPTREKPAVMNGELCIQTTARFGLSVDHRLVDGASAADFLSQFKSVLEHPFQKIKELEAFNACRN